jgi:hypothetical protein
VFQDTPGGAAGGSGGGSPDEILGRAGIGDLRPVDRLTGPAARPIATRNDRIDVSGNLHTRQTFGREENAWDRFEQQQRQRAQAVARSFAMLGTNLGMTLADGFSAGMSAAMQGKNPFTAFGKAVLGGLGSIFTQMGSELIAYGVIMMNLLPFLSNPFTSGPAAIAAGAALVALGSVLGGIATGGSKGGSGGKGGGFEDRTTRITLTADGLGGRTAPQREAGPTFEVIGEKHPRAARIIGNIQKQAARRNIG